ncbi:hypothetical protein [Methylocaldum szegediense]|jgi:hypothetical protein|uniref:Uncharacterized protein n=1 Tax=Methylocaldum szegediense TaxID=73780 RepID=A0ABM9HYH0_9GAMM|nr:hypothetical protein [Methylocaldum szegediense]CAI8761601.1 conserved protein of unknown function [Methylocaldum szegediense]
MATRKHRLCHHPELIQQLLDAADATYLDPQADRARLNRILDLVERLQRRNPQITLPRHFHFATTPRTRSSLLGPDTGVCDRNHAEPAAPECPASAAEHPRRASGLSRS